MVVEALEDALGEVTDDLPTDPVLATEDTEARGLCRDAVVFMVAIAAGRRAGAAVPLGANEDRRSAMVVTDFFSGVREIVADGETDVDILLLATLGMLCADFIVETLLAVVGLRVVTETPLVLVGLEGGFCSPVERDDAVLPVALWPERALVIVPPGRRAAPVTATFLAASFVPLWLGLVSGEEATTSSGVEETIGSEVGGASSAIVEGSRCELSREVKRCACLNSRRPSRDVVPGDFTGIQSSQ